MSRSARRLLMVHALGLALAGSSACVTRPCYPDSGIQLNARYRVTIVELYNQQSTFTYDPALIRANGLAMGTCPDALRPAAGDTIDIQATDTAAGPGKACLLVAGRVTSAPPAVDLIKPSTQAHGDLSLIYAAEDVNIAGCNGSLNLDLSPTKNPGGAFATPTPGSLPPAVLYWLFLPTSGCQPCDANYVVQLQEISM
jgi:hypothetical protein